ncbi:glycosyltransferase [Chloroflexi bacterium TSY]|nr:glycosyltransferase [Chloroflexi bacterium TSY]
MHGVFFWEAAGLSLDRANPYGGLLARALASVGVELSAGHPHEFTEEWLHQNQGQIDILHLNWPHHLYDAPDLAERVIRCAEVIDNLTLARTLGYKIVWTVHNLYPHDSENRELDHLARLAITQLATAVIVHCPHARTLVQQHFYRTDSVFVIPHGHFIDPYPNTISRTVARRQLGIPDDRFVFCSFGNVRPYKGWEALVEAFSTLSDEHLCLLLAAKVYSDYGEKFVEKARQADPRIVVSPSNFFANEEFQRYFNAADVAVFPFVDVLTSGSVITALSFGVPIIVPTVGCLSELVDEHVGILYDQDHPHALMDAMIEIQQQDLPALREAAYRRAQSLDWAKIAQKTVRAYQH